MGGLTALPAILWCQNLRERDTEREEGISAFSLSVMFFFFFLKEKKGGNLKIVRGRKRHTYIALQKFDSGERMLEHFGRGGEGRGGREGGRWGGWGMRTRVTQERCITALIN